MICMKRILFFAVMALVSSVAAYSQTESERYEQRYDILVSKMGAAGIGVETVLNNWEKVDSLNPKMLMGKFSYYLTKAQTPQVVSRSTRKYLGMEPVLTLKDSLGNDVYYFNENVFDDELYGQALKAADKAVSSYPDRLDFRFLKANAYVAYEKESPDMALAYIQDLIRDNSSRNGKWMYGDAEVDDDFFEDAMQEYCFSFYSIGSTASLEAFLSLSEQLYGLYPDNTDFLNNIGSYHLLKHEYKTSLKYYDKVLKKHPDDYTAMQNGLLASRKLKNVKLEKKYLTLIVRYGSDKDRMLAQSRLDALNSK